MLLNLQLDFLRHGETTGGKCFRGSIDDVLTERGLQQMHATMA